jgi:peptidoglycan-associated lipoprotein
MAWKKWIKLSMVISAVVVLSACSTTKKNNQNANVDDANAAYSAEASGLGQDSQFGDEGGSGRAVRGEKNVYYFDFDSNRVHEEDREAILAEADYLASHPHAKVLLEGHTDPRGSREYNIALGERRARAVADVLSEKGVHSDQVRVVSYGAQKLAATGQDDEAFRLDRRVVLVYLKK